MAILSGTAVFVINLPERVERKKHVSDTFESFNIPFITWSAIKNEDGKKGLRETMRLLFLHCIAAGYKRVCVFEDDAKIIRQNLVIKLIIK